jgi:hypothetical protein
MDFLRLYLGEVTGLILVLALVFAGAAISARYVSDRRKVIVGRNLCVALALAGFAASMAASLVVNQAPKAQID